MTHQLARLSAQLGRLSTQLGKLSLVVSIQLALPLLMLGSVQPLGIIKPLPIPCYIDLPSAHCSCSVMQAPAHAIQHG